MATATRLTHVETPEEPASLTDGTLSATLTPQQLRTFGLTP